MAKDDRVIHTGVRMEDGTVVTDPDELEKSASPEQIAYLTERGAISGSFKAGKKAEAKEEKAAKK